MTTVDRQARGSAIGNLALGACRIQNPGGKTHHTARPSRTTYSVAYHPREQLSALRLVCPRFPGSNIQEQPRPEVTISSSHLVQESCHTVDECGTTSSGSDAVLGRITGRTKVTRDLLPRCGMNRRIFLTRSSRCTTDFEMQD